MILSCRRQWQLRFLAVVLILLTAAVSLYGRGSKEDQTLTRADEFIKQKEYDQAMQLLSEYLKDNPDRFGEAQKRLQMIIKLREQYNQIANDLLDLLETDPGNNEKILELSNLLLTIESPSNPATRQFLDQVRYLAEFNVNRKRLEQILLASRERLNANDFSGALASYASGLDIYQQVYFSSGYGEAAEDTASRGLGNINENIRIFNSAVNPFSRATRALSDSLARDPPIPSDIGSTFLELIPNMNEIAAIKKGFVDTQISFDDQLGILQREQGVFGDRSFLSFASRLIAGPSGLNEGMIGTMDRFWRYWIDPVETALNNIVNTSYNTGFTAMINFDFSEGLWAFNDTTLLVLNALDLAKSWNSLFEAAGGQSYSIYGEMISEEKAGLYLKFRAMNNSLAYLIETGNIGNLGSDLEADSNFTFSSWQDGAIDTLAAISGEQNLRISYQDLIDGLISIEGRLQNEIETIRSYIDDLAGIPGGVGLPQTYFNDTRNLVINLNSRFRTYQLNSIVRMYIIANGDLEKRTNDRENEFAGGNSLIQGISRENEERGVYTALYPAEGLEMLTRMNRNLEADLDTARSLVSQYEAEPPNVLDAAEVNSLYVSARNFLNRLLSLQTRSTPIMAAARTQVERAASFRFEGDRLFQAAQAALSRNDLNGARTNLARSSEQYNASLAIQESDSLRAATDAQGQRLGAEIVRVENEIVVRDVRDLVTTARNLYFQGNMEQAETALVNAQNRWRDTNVIEQPEVEYWLNLVRGAMSIQSGRTIPVTAPLYAEMSQLLSDASRNYNEGVRLLGDGRRQEGIARFNEARDKTREVRLIFPLNQNARMLELMIEQQLDPVAFNANFQQRLSEAVSGTKVKNLQAFADLQDLAGINPRYPGIQAILTQAEYDMDYRQPPPDPRDLARSAELSRNAQAVINARDSIRYEAAQTWLNEAIKLNPNNVQAQTDMDTLNILMYGTGTIYIPTYAMDLFNQAQQEFLRGNYLTANSIVIQLLQNPEYRKSTQIQDLKRRIDSVL